MVEKDEKVFAQIKKCIAFIFVKNNMDQFVPNGTGFFISVATKNDPDRSHVYLATAKHVLQDGNGNYYTSIGLRINKHDGTSSLVEVSLTNVTIFTHDERDVDVALFSCVPSNNVDYLSIPPEMIANKETMTKMDIGEGDDVFFAGLFTSHIGQKRNQPIIRFGKVSLISDEKIEWKEQGKPAKFLELYLLECQSFGGNSGSPVFFQLSPYRKPGVIEIGPPKIYLAGVMTGSFNAGNPIASVETRNEFFSLQNIGIAAVTPAYKLFEVLFSEKLRKLRNE
jgi:hypothetical protein